MDDLAINGPKTEDLETAINQLKRGLVSNHFPTKAKAYQKIYHAGSMAIPLLLRELQVIELKKSLHPGTLLIATGLLVILHDLDEKVSESFVKEATSQQCDPIFARAFKSILRFKRSNFQETDYLDLIILEDKAIDKRYQATNHILKWLETIPPEDLEGVPRIYIIPYKSHYDYAGYYLPYIGVITIVWYTNEHPFGPVQPINRFLNQSTLYHEIGHHFHRHVEGGAVPEQEKEANAYASKMLGSARPKLKMFFKVLSLLRGKKRKKSR